MRKQLARNSAGGRRKEKRKREKEVKDELKVSAKGVHKVEILVKRLNTLTLIFLSQAQELARLDRPKSKKELRMERKKAKRS